MSRRVFVVGVGMTKFERPGSRQWDYPQMGAEAIQKALADCSLPFSLIEQAACGYVYGDSTCGQRALYEVGITGIPVYNVNNNCSTGSTALFMARNMIASGQNHCVLAVGFEKMEKGSLKAKWEDRTNPLDRHINEMLQTHGFSKAPFAPQLFGNAGREHMQLYGTTVEHFAKIAEKNHRHSVNNPYSQFRDVYTLEQILQSKKVHEPLTMLQCCPTSEGGAAAVLVSEEYVMKYGLQNKAVEIVGMAMATDLPSSFGEKSMIKTVGFDMTKTAAEKAYKEAGVGPKDVQVVELHDCFSANELITYEALGLCEVGKAGEFIDRGDNTYGGKYVVNPSGGLISKGHPLGATGLAQCAELTWQLRGEAEKRQVPNARIALQHNLGLGGAVVVTVYKKPEFKQANAVRGLQANPTSGSTLKSAALFDEMKKRINSEMVQKVKAVFRFDVKPDSGDGEATCYHVDLKNGDGALTVANQPADCVIGIKDSDLVALLSGKLNPQQAFMEGKIKLKGNMMLAQKLQYLMPAKAKL